MVKLLDCLGWSLMIYCVFVVGKLALTVGALIYIVQTAG